jgi:hypothetical protein
VVPGKTGCNSGISYKTQYRPEQHREVEGRLGSGPDLNHGRGTIDARPPPSVRKNGAEWRSVHAMCADCLLAWEEEEHAQK